MMKVPVLFRTLVIAAVAFAAVAPARAQHGSAKAADKVGEALIEVGGAVADAAAALAADDFAAYQRAQPAVKASFAKLAAAQPALAKALVANVADPLPTRANIGAARKDFPRLSSGICDALRARKLVQPAKLKIYECTMVPEVGTARWPQREAGAKNPFFGAKMLTCGTEVDGPAVPGTHKH